jgi:hypothetical protein
MTTKEKLLAFANKHQLILEEKGECGFGRPCVGFLSKGGINYVDYNPSSYDGYKDIWEYDDRLCAPEGVKAYHKHYCMAVLVTDDNYEEGLNQLLKWVEHLESQGEVEVVEYATGAVGVQAIISGITGYAIRFKQ